MTELVNACDAGREGELIFRLVYEAAGCSKPFSRLWISSMEDAAIREGFADLHPGGDYDPLYQSALCRQKADWLIGINASRLFSVLYHRTLNIGAGADAHPGDAGRPGQKIVLFRKEKYHHVRLALEGAEAVSDRIVSPEDAQAIRDACDGQRAVCVSLVREKKTENPPKLYDLTTLQREANRVFGYTAKQTLDYAQSLYEKKLLTYPRTDSRYLTGDMAETASVVLHLAARVTPFDACPVFPRCSGAGERQGGIRPPRILIPLWSWKKRTFRGRLWASAISFCWSAASCCVRRRSLSCMRRSRPPLIAADIPSRQKESRCFPRAGAPSRRCSVPP